MGIDINIGTCEDGVALRRLADRVLGDGSSFVYSASDAADILSVSDSGHVLLSANSFEQGRGVYLADLPYNLHNARLLLRAILWAARREQAVDAWVCDNPLTDCAAYPEVNLIAVINHTAANQQTTFHDHTGTGHSLELAPHELRWLPYS